MAENENERDVSGSGGSGGSASSLLPMLISGLLLIVIGMIAVAAFT